MSRTRSEQVADAANQQELFPQAIPATRARQVLDTCMDEEQAALRILGRQAAEQLQADLDRIAASKHQSAGGALKHTRGKATLLARGLEDAKAYTDLPAPGSAVGKLTVISPSSQQPAPQEQDEAPAAAGGGGHLIMIEVTSAETEETIRMDVDPVAPCQKTIRARLGMGGTLLLGEDEIPTHDTSSFQEWDVEEGDRFVLAGGGVDPWRRARGVL